MNSFLFVVLGNMAGNLDLYWQIVWMQHQKKLDWSCDILLEVMTAIFIN